MKQLLTLLFVFIAGQKCLATEWALYYVYIQTDYIQGPWKRTNVLDKSGAYTYLHPIQYEELFGTERIDFVNAVYNHLKIASPERYTFKCSLSLSEDTVLIQTNDSITDFEAVKNELIASFILNNFAAVKIIQSTRNELYHLKDISIPYMDLVFPEDTSMQALTKTITPSDSLAEDTLVPDIPKITSEDRSIFKPPIWLILSVIINIILLALLLRKKQ